MYIRYQIMFTSQKLMYQKRQILNDIKIRYVRHIVLFPRNILLFLSNDNVFPQKIY